MTAFAALLWHAVCILVGRGIHWGQSFSSTKLLDKTIVAITNAVDYLVMVCGLVGPLLYSEDALYEVALVGCLDRNMKG